MDRLGAKMRSEINISFAAICLIGAALFAPISAATPPMMANMTDTPIAMSNQYLYSIRVVDDNMGRYAITRSKTYIIKQDIRTGETTMPTWINESLLNHDQRFGEPDSKPASSLKSNSAFNLFTYLENQNAFPLTGLSARPEETQFGLRLKNTGEGIIVSRDARTDKNQEVVETAVLRTADIREALNATIEPVLNDYFGPVDPDSASEVDAMSRRIEPNMGCETINIKQAPLSVSADKTVVEKDIYFITVHCPSGELANNDWSNLDVRIDLAFELNFTK